MRTPRRVRTCPKAGHEAKNEAPRARPALRAGLPAAALLVAVMIPALPLIAQEDGGIELRATLTQRFERLTNASLDPDSDGTTLRSNTGLGFVLTSGTRLDRVTLGFGGSLRRVDAPLDVDSTDFGFESPYANLRYARSVGDASFETGIGVNVEDISYLESLGLTIVETDTDTDTVDDTPVVDLDERYGTGTRRRIRADAALRFGIDGPAELGLFANVHSIRYSDAGSSSEDSDSYGLRGLLSLALAPDLTLDGGLGYSQFRNDSDGQRDTWTMNLALARSLPRGTLSTSVRLTQTEDGTRSTAGLGWVQPLPEGSARASIGLTRATNGDLGLSGALHWDRSLPEGDVSASLGHGYAANDDDRETMYTNAALSLSRPLTRLTSLDLGVAYVQNEIVDTDTSNRQGEISAGISHQLGHDWSLGAGYRHIERRENDADWAGSDNLYLSIGRSFSVRY